MILSEILHVAIIPAAVAAIATFIAQQVRIAQAAVWSIGIGLGYVAGQLALANRNAAPTSLWALLTPREAVEWLPYAVLIAIGISMAASFAGKRWRAPLLALSAIFCLGLPIRLLAGSAYSIRWALVEKVIYLGVIAATLAAIWTILATASPGQQPRLRPALLAVVACVSAVACVLSGVFVYGELCGVLVAAIAGTYLVCGDHNLEGAAGVITFSLGTLIVLSYFYAQLNMLNAALLLLATCVGAGRLPTFVTSRSARQQIAIRTALTLLPLAAVLVRLFLASQADVSTDPYDV
jgi:hypothetical protein